MLHTAEGWNSVPHARALQVIGSVPSGLSILRVPSMEQPWLPLLVDSVPIALISYMESISVATKIATAKGYISMLNPSQELFALGLGNVCNAFVSGFSVSGSFSRSGTVPA